MEKVITLPEPLLQQVSETARQKGIEVDALVIEAVERYLETTADHPDILVNPMVQGMPVGFAYESIRAFVDALALGKPIRATMEDGIKVSQVILAIFESAAKRSPVEVDYSL